MGQNVINGADQKLNPVICRVTTCRIRTSKANDVSVGLHGRNKYISRVESMRAGRECRGAVPIISPNNRNNLAPAKPTVCTFKAFKVALEVGKLRLNHRNILGIKRG